MTKDLLPTVDIPPRLKGFVYVVGMLGFPIIVATWFILVLSTDMKSVQKELTLLATRISERPMGLERSTDFAIYITEAMRDELLAGLSSTIGTLELSVENPNSEKVSRTLTFIRREMSNYIRPIVRKHQRFASRFPTVGGNLGTFFSLSSPGVDINEGETEASLRSKESQQFSEALLAMIMNNIGQFGNESILAHTSRDEYIGNIDANLAKLLGIEIENPEEEEKKKEPQESNLKIGQMEVIQRKNFLKLSQQSVIVGCTVLRDQMLENVRANSSELDR